MTESFNIENFIRQRTDIANISNKSHIVTVFGDIISQHGGWVWLGSLIDSLQPLGFSERLVRTSVFRLVKEDWLQVKKVGRKSFYAFTESAHNHYTKAARRIYADKSSCLNESWLLVLPVFVFDEKLSRLKRQLQWLGFSPLCSGVYAHPSIARSSLEETINEMKLNDSVIIFCSKTLDQSSDKALKKLVFEKWNIQQLKDSYHQLINNYQPVVEEITRNKTISDQQCYLLRSLLIHEYRRILLKDHQLAENLLPNDWPGFLASQLVKQLYALVAESSNRYISSHLQNIEGYLPMPSEEFFQRFQ